MRVSIAHLGELERRGLLRWLARRDRLLKFGGRPSCGDTLAVSAPGGNVYNCAVMGIDESFVVLVHRGLPLARDRMTELAHLLGEEWPPVLVVQPPHEQPEGDAMRASGTEVVRAAKA